jgi:tetratricopeptide (TPR) repeat protein
MHFTNNAKIDNNCLPVIKSRQMTNDQGVTSISTAYDEAVKLLRDQLYDPAPRLDGIITRFKEIANRQPSNDDDKLLICNAKQNIGVVISLQHGLDYKISKDAIKYFEESIMCYQLLVEDVKKKADNTSLAKLYYNIANTKFRIAEIKRDQYNTDNSKMRFLPSRILLDPKITYQEVLDELNKMPSLNDDPAALNLMAVAFSRLNNFASADIYYTKAINLQNRPDFGEYLNAIINKGMLLYKEKQYRLATDYFYKYYAYNEKETDVLVLIGDVNLNLNNYDTALEFYQKANNITEQSDFLNGIALSYLFSGGLDEAYNPAKLSLSKFASGSLINNNEVNFSHLDDYTIRGKELIVEVLCILGTIHMKKEDRKEALSYVAKAKAISERYSLEMVSPFFLEGLLLMEDKKFAKARKSLDQAIDIKKDYAEALNVLGICHHNMGNTQEAIDMIKKAVEIKPELASAHINLYRLERYKDKDVDPGFYWIKSKKRIAALAAIIFIGLLISVHSIQYPNRSSVDSTTTNYTITKGGLQQTVTNSNTIRESSSFQSLSLAIVIGLIVIILWPSIRSLKVGASSLEIEKLTQIEDKEDLYLSWIKIDEILHRSLI